MQPPSSVCFDCPAYVANGLLGLPAQLERILSTTNAIENLFSRARHTTRRVKNWKDGRMVLRWMVTALHDVSLRFRRVMSNGGIAKLVAALHVIDSRPLAAKTKAASASPSELWA